MRFSLFTLPALAVFAAAAPTAMSNEVSTANSPLADMITGLTEQVRGFTANMNQVTASMPADASEEQKKAAAASAIKDIEGMTAAFQATNNQLAAAQQQQSSLVARQGQGLQNLPKDVLGQLNGQPIVFARLLNTLLRELNPAVQSLLLTLSLGEVYVALQPLLRVQLPLLLTNVGNLVNGLLVSLAPLLAGLGGILGPLLLSLGL
ncbi:uncharacterized protein RCC_02237 [Ramularia collo-cygni]|uniref:Uncharacterized protein n=1 Tax=Ramularia collo-cygni TaxID=112498 RepID=A0A2D3V1Q8_9PEZI|nr:uncharacterized protein RCC_02237 [Ramularia collo-cygni]CZT16394.1 uncharacterized protein RCC_02237 [Ramularia collo-cygni]